MRDRDIGIFGALLLATALVVSRFSYAAEASNPPDEWRIECSGNAESSGYADFLPTSAGSQSTSE